VEKHLLSSVHGLSIEVKQLLSKARPGTLAAAKRIQGVTPVAVLELIRHTKKAQALISGGQLV
jgi:tRNA uridine 5-carboxymethylaminomethyl modification enzyme